MQDTNIEGFRLSPQQKHLWLLQQNGYEPVYRVYGSILIEGNINPEALNAALETVVHRYEILNTTFHQVPGLTIPVQVINEPNGLLLDEHNLSELGSQEKQAKLETLLREERHLEFDLEHGPLLKIVQVVLSPQKRLLHISLPALCGDVTTVKNLVNEISNNYDAHIRGVGANADDEIMQYADISEWQNEVLESEDDENGKIYWRKQNISDLLDIRFPFEKSPEGSQVFAPKCLSLEVDSAIVSKVEEFTEKKKVSVSAFLLACWQVLLSRLTGQSSFVIGAACDGRTYEELQGTLGLLAKYLPVGCYLEENLRFIEHLEQVNKSVNENLEWQEYFSWDEIAATEKSAPDAAFFPVCFNYEEVAKVVINDISFSLDQHYACIDRFKVKCSCIRSEESLVTEFHYDSNLIDSDNIEQLSKQFHLLLKNIISHPEATVGDFEILSGEERKQILVGFNNTCGDIPENKCIHHIIEEQAKSSPDAAAVIFEDRELSYAELNARANQLAHHLQKLGVGPEVPVGIYLDPSLEMIVGLLAILKAGGAYVPLAPEYPPDRIASILKDTQAPVLLTQTSLQSGVSKNGAKLICLDSEWEKIAIESDENPNTDVTAENLAYIIFTSGSTGRPKGVPISHQNLVHSTHARLTYYKEPVNRFLLLSSFSFDSSIVGLFWSLCSGGTLVLPEAGLQRDPQQVAELISEKKITHMLGLPSLYSLLLAEAGSEKLSSLDTIIVAGEACPKDLVKRHNELFPRIKLYNEYGPTEGTVWSSVYDCSSQKLEMQVPIGNPILNSQIYLLNANMRPVPVGIAGELYIGGPGLTRGYLNRPELAADMLVPNPFGDKPGTRLYRTGDLARYLPDGNIEFLGRADHQVKIRGYRIELGEIETVLNQHAAVKENVIVARDSSSEQETPAGGEQRLVAYVVLENAEQPKITELRSFINERLPEFMVPSFFVLLQSLPLTPNGKVDRKALPELDHARPDLEETFVGPRNQVEEVLTGIWTEILDVEKIGVHDNFFELGGHSILVTRLVSRIRDALQVEVPLRTIFEMPTVAELTEMLFQDPEKKYKIEKTAQLLVRLANLSEAEAAAMLEEKSKTKSN